MHTNDRGVMIPAPAGYDVLPYPHRGHTDITDGLPLGRILTPEATEVRLPAGPFIVVSARGHGKTNTLRSLIAGRATCVNAVTWLIDTGSNGLAADAVRAHAADRSTPPLVDWIAPDPVNAVAVAAAARRVIDYRARIFGRKMLLSGEARLAPTVEHPDVSIVVDGDNVEPGTELFTLLTEVNQLGPTGGVSVAFAGLRPESVRGLVTADTVISVDRYNASNVEVFGWGHYLLTGLPRDMRGASWIGYADQQPTQQRGYLTSQNALWNIVRPSRAGLTDETVNALGRDYACRWTNKAVTEFLDYLSH